MTYRKRRIRPAPNKNAAKVRRRQATENLPPLDAVYPQVESLSVDLRFFNSRGDSLSERRAEFGPSDPADFEVRCPGLCGDGRMDLAGKIDEIVRRGETETEARGKCMRPLFLGSQDLCGHELRCRIRVAYRNN